MRIGRIDAAATRGTSALHVASPRVKLVAFALVLGAVVASTNVLVVVAIALSLAAAVIALKLPWRAIFGLAAYPGIFAALFAFAAAPGWLATALIVAKAITAALAAVMLVFTTPYPQIFAPVQRLVPGVLGDALLMTYRSLFLLIDTFDHTLTAVRLRSGLSGFHPVRAAKVAVSSLGIVSLYSLDLSQRTYDVMRLRGYDGRLVVSARRAGPVSVDAGVLAAGVAICASAVAFRTLWRYLNPVSWLLPAVAALFLLGAIAWSVSHRKERS
jgi:energy-coupling factor transporter transmembrane protein EcfT